MDSRLSPFLCMFSSRIFRATYLSTPLFKRQSSSFEKMSKQYAEEWKVLERVFGVIRDKLNPEAQRNTPVINYTPPEDLKHKFDVKLRDEPCQDTDTLVKLCEDVVDNSVKTGNPMFLNQLFHGADPYGAAAGMLLTALNTNAHIFEIAPALAVIENEVIETLCDVVGFDDGDGIFCSGGSQANMFGLNLARFNYNKEVKQTGLFQATRLSVFTSQQSHYSVLKAAAFMGLGTDSVIKVACDETGAMIPADLQRLVAQEKALGRIPLMVWCTSGTTIVNGFDPLPQLTAIAREHEMWVHVDACLGGPMLLSQKNRYHMEGIEKVDSLTWNWHKIQGSPVLTTVFLSNHKGLLKQCHSASASYLFMKKKYYDTAYDLGDASLQCGRTADALKVWLMWKARGRSGLAACVDQTVEAAELLCEKMKQHPDRFILLLPRPQATTNCFWMVPPSMKGWTPADKERQAELDQAAQDIKERMVKRGLAMLTYQPLEDLGYPNFFRITLACHPSIQPEDVDQIIEILLEVSNDL